MTLMLEPSLKFCGVAGLEISTGVPGLRHWPWQARWRQRLCFCTSKASKASKLGIHLLLRERGPAAVRASP